jgi:hypothetical protein
VPVIKNVLSVLHRKIILVYFENREKHINTKRERSATKQCSFANLGALSAKVVPLLLLVCKPSLLKLLHGAGIFEKNCLHMSNMNSIHINKNE